MKQPQRTGPLLALTLCLILSGCSGQKKPALSPKINTQVPIATHLRPQSSIPTTTPSVEEMTSYLSLTALKKERDEGDPDLKEVQRIYWIPQPPTGLVPLYYAKAGRVEVRYVHEASADLRLSLRTERVPNAQKAKEELENNPLLTSDLYGSLRFYLEKDPSKPHATMAYAIIDGCRLSVFSKNLDDHTLRLALTSIRAEDLTKTKP
ncbi:hypothetical protein ABB02_01097 [Clostridiaceae bacterium JG1575]|nr:hypothetical protein ABB02_01097 [Clostridiaceae bacterium JG1575]